MVKAKTINERIQDICNRSGLSADIVNRVMDARAESILDDLKNGMRVVDYGVCSLTPTVGQKVGIGGIHNVVAVKCKVSPKITDTLNEVPDYQVDTSDDDKGSIRVKTLPAFT